MSTIPEHFSNLPDPPRTKEHKLINILFIIIAAVICGTQDWNDIAFYGQQKKDWLRTIPELPNKIPSHYTFNRVFSLIEPHSTATMFYKPGAVHSRHKRRRSSKH